MPEDDGSAEIALRKALAGRYNTVRPFLALLGESPALAEFPASDGEKAFAPPDSDLFTYEVVALNRGGDA